MLAALVAATGLGFAGSLALANVPTVQFQDVREMDTNKNGKVEKSEFLAATGVQFDKAAGEKGYCTYQEITDGLRAVQEWWRHSQ